MSHKQNVKTRVWKSGLLQTPVLTLEKHVNQLFTMQIKCKYFPKNPSHAARGQIETKTQQICGFWSTERLHFVLTLFICY